MKPNAGYYRLSKQEQVKPGVEESHRFQIKRAIEREGGTIAEPDIYHDIMSGRKNDRPDFQRLLNAVEHGRYSAVFIRLDRMSRNAELFHDIERAFRKSKTKLYDLGKYRFVNFDDPRDWGDYHRAGIQAQEESLVTGYRIKLRKEFARSQGQVQGGRLPYGYRRNSDGIYEINEEQKQNALRMIDIYFECGTSAIAAVRQIEIELGIKYTYFGLLKWLNSPVLRGNTPYWGRSSKGEGENGAARYPTQIIYNTHPALIDSVLSARISDAIALNAKRRGTRAAHRTYPLSGLLYCDRCGSVCNITSYTNPNQKTRIYCRNHRKMGNCKGSTVYATAEAIVIESLRLAAEEIAEVGILPDDNTEIETEEMKQIRQQIVIYEQMHSQYKDDRLLQLINENRGKLLELTARESGTQTSVMELRRQLVAIAQAAESWDDFFALATGDRRVVLFRTFVDSVHCDGESVRVVLRV